MSVDSILILKYAKKPLKSDFPNTSTHLYSKATQGIQQI